MSAADLAWIFFIGVLALIGLAVAVLAEPAVRQARSRRSHR